MNNNYDTSITAINKVTSQLGLNRITEISLREEQHSG